jgi:hypothetical protein
MSLDDTELLIMKYNVTPKVEIKINKYHWYYFISGIDLVKFFRIFVATHGYICIIVVK